MTDLLKIEGLSISFPGYEVIQNLSLTVGQGELVTIVGASGSGKSLLAHALLGILPPTCTVCGKLYFEGEPLTPRRIQQLRGKEIALVPQSVTYLDPLTKVGAQVRQNRGDFATRQKQQSLFLNYALPCQTEGLYPFELSGGMTRRVFLSAAMMSNPKLIIADEPTPGLDWETAKQVLAQFRAFTKMGGSVLLITHDVELALKTADRIFIFYAGQTIEETAATGFSSEDSLRHPYAKALWRALPQNGLIADQEF